MRRLLTKDEILQLVSQVPQEPLPWIYNEHQRKEAFQQILAEGDRGKLIQMLRTLYLQKKRGRRQEGSCTVRMNRFSVQRKNCFLRNSVRCFILRKIS